MTKRREPIPPTIRAVDDCLAEFARLEKYQLHESALALLYRELCPRHDDLPKVLLKVSALNDFYSTNIYDTHAVAKHIVQVNPGAGIEQGDPAVVNSLSVVTIGGKRRSCYSFATKYCSHHNPEAFPIFDSFVQKMLTHFRRKDKFASFKNDELKDYPKFVEIIGCFQRHYDLDARTVRDIDIYLWLAGKQAFGS